MKHRLPKYLYSFFCRFHTILIYMIVVCMVGIVAPSCSGTKKSSSIKKIERESKKAERGSKGKEVKKAEKAQAQKEKERKKEEEKAYQDGITRHRAFQTEETRNRMDTHLDESNTKYSKKKEFFLVRWFRPKDDIEKLEKKRAKEVEKRMAANRKQSEKNNEDRRATSFEGKERKVSKPDPANIQIGGGGTYKEGSSKSVNPSDIQIGGGGTYKEEKSKSRVNPSSIQQGGGGNMSGGKSKKVKPDSGTTNTKGTSPRKNPFSRKEKPQAGK